MSRLTIGCDPGCSGAYAIMAADGTLELVSDWPVITDKSLKWVDGGALQSQLIDALHGRPAIAVVERVASRPGQGVSSTFAFGVAFGSILSLLQALNIGIELVAPSTWKAAAGLTGSDKKASLHRARLLYPAADLRLERHHNRADAILLARHAITRRAA